MTVTIVQDQQRWRHQAIAVPIESCRNADKFAVVTDKESDVEDRDVLGEISKLVEEEHQLRSGPPVDEAGRERIRELEIQLDRCWDLLRRREAREEFGQNPDQEHEQPATVVERYLQ